MKGLTKVIILTVIMLIFAQFSTYANDIDQFVDGRPQIGVLLEAPLSFCNDSKTNKIVIKKMNLLFPDDKFNVLSLDAGLNAIQVYREEKDMTGLVSNGWTTYAVPLKKEDLISIGNKLNCNYILFMRLSNDMPSYSNGLFTKSAKTTIICDVRLLDIAGKNYKYTKQILSKGRSTAIYMGSPSFKRSYYKAFEKALKEVNDLVI